MPELPPHPERPEPGPSPGPDVTALLVRMEAGDDGAAEALLPLVYDQLRAMAGGMFRMQRADHTLQPTALVHEAYLKLVNARDPAWNGRSHFCAVAATAMRQILKDHARRKRAVKRGGGEGDRVPLDNIETPSSGSLVDATALDDALSKLEGLDQRQARIVELRFFGGLTNRQVGEVLGLSERTIEMEWRATRAWLARELGAGDGV